MVERFIPGTIYEMSPTEAQELCSRGYVFLWKDKIQHNDGEPKIRKYEFVGKWKRGEQS